MDQKLPDYLNNYAKTYIHKFNDICSQLEDLAIPASFYAKPIVSIAIFKASDGFALFYLPQDPNKTRPEINFVICDTMLLSQLVQSVTVNLIKVLLPPSEPIRSDLSNWKQMFNLPPDLPIDITKQAKYQTLNQKLTDAAIRGGKLDATGMAITPTLHFQNGIPIDVSPTRYRIFSLCSFTPR